MPTFTCQNPNQRCTKTFAVKDELAGRRANCPVCGFRNTVPQPHIELNQGQFADDEQEEINISATPVTSTTSLSVLRTRAEFGDSDAMLQLGYELNKIEDSDPEEILYWMEKAADLGNAQALFEIADIYRANGDVQGAFDCLLQSAQNGYTKAKHNLAVCYLAGSGTTQDNHQAFYWMEQASKEGHAGARRKMGLFYMEGIGISMDRAKGLSLLREAASMGDEEAPKLLNEIQRGGRGISRSLIGMMVGRFFGIIGEGTKMWAGAGWGMFREEARFEGYGAAAFQTIIGLLLNMIWYIPYLCIKLILCPFVVTYEYLTEK